MISDLRAAVGRRHVLTGRRRTARYRTGFRCGVGDALAVVFPGSLGEQWASLQICTEAGAIVIMQAANTGLTGGSVPDGGDYDRPVVIINTLRLARIDLIEEGRQVVCLAGATLHRLETVLKAVGRKPHSVIGSSCIGASVVGGVSNNSGGSLVARGPAYTELALYARVGHDGRLTLVNNLGIDLGRTPEEILGRLDRKDYRPADIAHDHRRASDAGYAARVRDVAAATPARYNADPRRLNEASGSAGKLAIFAVRLDTFAGTGAEQVFYVGTDDPAVLTGLRRHILSRFEHLPVAGEYMDRATFDVARRYGKDTFVLIDRMGTAWMPRFFTLKGRLDAFLGRMPWLPAHLADRMLQAVADLLPEVLPARLLAFRDRFSHHMMLKVSGPGVSEARAHLSDLFGPEGTGGAERGDWFACTSEEGDKAFLHRFAAAGAAIRLATLNGGSHEDLVALDVALPRNALDWREVLPGPLAGQCEVAMYYGHFLCHVFHQDYVLRKGSDAHAFKAAVLALQDARDAEYPAEHNVGNLYAAKPTLRDFYKTLDPTNAFNAGVGKMSKLRHYGCGCADQPGFSALAVDG